MKNYSLNSNNQINIGDDVIEFNTNLINYWESLQNDKEKRICIFNNKLPISLDFKAWFNYFQKEERTILKIENKDLSKIEVENLIKDINWHSGICSISLLVDNSSSALVFLNHWSKISQLKSITLYISKKSSIHHNYEVRETVIKLLKQGKRVKISYPKRTVISYLSEG